uniref:Transcription initiation factor IIE, alpha FINGER, Transcription n=1 Tax=Siphoviridae sp. ctqSm5 TaxID=2827949 RepID=A0A8S5SP75_9CAUD|nr:MAG TPA: Transcription initiation factor IIE, alpha FINGER, Transcription [Siphoviridae sp. ctqSm5]
MAKNVKVKTPEKNYTFVCSRCKQVFKSDQFYSFPNNAGLLSVCKECMYEYAIKDNALDRTGLIDLLRFLDMPFLQNYYTDVTKKKVSGKWQLSQYFGKLRLNSATHMMHFKDSSFEDIDTETFKGIYELPEEVVELTTNPIVDDEPKVSKVEEKNARFKELQAKWGNYQSLEFLERCEKLYTEMVEGGYQILSAMHHNSLITYVQLQIKWNIAMETDDFAKLKELKQPLNDARNAAKVTVQQLKASDLSNGGANSFGEIAKIVARKDGFIPLPMKYIKQPNDHLDFMMWEIINYLRHCIGQEEVSYEEIMAHYQKRVDKFNQEYNADIESGDYGDLDPKTKGTKKEKHYF